MLKRIGLYITLFWSFTSNAQYLSVRGDFSIDQQRGCRNLLVTVTNINPGTDVILYQYEGKTSPVTANTNFLYSTTGSYWLFQYIQGATGQKADSIFVEILDPVMPDFELHSCNNNDIQVVINDTAYDVYEIDYGDGTIIQIPVSTFPPLHSYAGPAPVAVTVTGLYTTSFKRCGNQSINFTPVNQVQPAQFNLLAYLDDQSLIIQYNIAPNTVTSLEVSLNNTSTYQLFKNLDQGTTIDTLTNLQLPLTTYCFRIASHDACSNFKAYSNELCSIFANAQAVNNSIDLSWDTVFPVNYSNTEVLRDNLSIASLPNQALAYADTTVVCNTNYCYYLDAFHSDGSISRSNQVCDDAFSSDIPEAVKDISANIIADEIRWSWLAPPNEQVQVYNIFNQAGGILGSTALNMASTLYPEDAEVCIKLQLTNICDNSSGFSQITCPLLLDKTLNGDGSITLNWSDFSGWQNGVNNYSVMIYDVDMIMIDSIAVGNLTEYTDPLPADNNQVSHYIIWAQANDNGIEYSSSNLIKVERPPVIAVPNSFTPNGDNLNDLFIVSGKYIKSVDLSIINRWGSTIYQVNGSSWDGSSNGSQVPLGTYVYHLIIKDFANNEHIRTGTVLILDD